jgi:OOP family OmpA-OmpF porin
MKVSYARHLLAAFIGLGMIVQCGSRLAAQPNDSLELENLGSGVNSRYDDVGPVISPDGRTLYLDRTDDPSNYGNDDIWFSTLDADGKWSAAKNIGPPLNNRDHNFVSSVTPDGNTLLLGNVYNADGSMGPGVSMVHRVKKGWGTPEKLDIENYYSLSLSANYYLANDGKTLLMAVERNDTRGDLDLYVSFRQPSGQWSSPLNLGDNVNTRGADRTPFLAADGVTLYFASDGHGGLGSSDIFVSRRLDSSWQNWSKPENLGKPINTEGWDGFFTIPASGDYAYLVSAQNSLGSADIFRVRLRSSMRPRPVALVSGNVYDVKTKKPLAAEITYEEAGSTRGSGTARTDPSTGAYKITLPVGSRYTLKATSDGYGSARGDIDLAKTDVYTEAKRDFFLKGGAPAVNTVLFESGSADLTGAAKADLDRLLATLKKDQAGALEIAGYADANGEDGTNLELSERRATTVMNYLIAHGVDAARLTAHGYGEADPVGDNTTASGRRLNRRVEFRK